MWLDILNHALIITGFVFIMMLLIEYINVQTRGNWQDKLRYNPWGQYVLSAFLGAVPGCLGSFTVVSLYSHRVLSIGALTAAMIATSGDEAYVMFSMFPLKALGLTAILFLLGIIAGYITDRVLKDKTPGEEKHVHELELHTEEFCSCFSWQQFMQQIKQLSFPRGLLIIAMLFLTISFLSGFIGEQEWGWVRVTLVISSLFAFFVVSTVPDHFLEKHLWEHVVKKHLLRIFLWTFVALFVIHVLENYLDVAYWVKSNTFTTLMLAVLIGIIPESGPHLVFVSLYAQGVIPFSILLASSIVHDGHGMLPLLAISKRSFVIVKLINVGIGFLIGLLAMQVGW
ncbi:MAG TPA: hypothetical protein EYP36_07690 [Calditrichaeota bacterium]|nr:hypothetical protein [Calditrichota bacterium]